MGFLFGDCCWKNGIEIGGNGEGYVDNVFRGIGIICFNDI